MRSDLLKSHREQPAACHRGDVYTKTFFQNRECGSFRGQMELVDFDFQEFLNGSTETCCKFQGEFMRQYSWAESAVYGL